MQTQRTADGGQVVDLFPLDRRGRRRTPSNSGANMRGRRHPNRGKKFGPNPMTPTQVHALLQACSTTSPRHVDVLTMIRLRAMIVVMWRAGLRVSELLDLEEDDLSPTEGTITVRNGKGRDGRHEIVGMDPFGWRELDVWLRARAELPFGALFCILHGPTAGKAMHATQLRRDLKRAAARAGVRHRANPHSLRHSMAVDMRHEGIDLFVVSKQLRHGSLNTTQIYLEEIDPVTVIKPAIDRSDPMVPIQTPR